MSEQSLTDLNLQPLLSPRETAAILGVTYETLSVWRSSGRYPLRFVKIGRRVMYRPEDVKAFIEERLHEASDNDPTAVSARQAEWRALQYSLFDDYIDELDDAEREQ